jgi:hypothetical protein
LNAHGYSLRTDTVFEYYSPELESQIADSERRLRELEAKMPIEGEPAGPPGSDFAPAGCGGNARTFDTGWFGNWVYGLRFYGYYGYDASFILYPYVGVSARVEGMASIDKRIVGSENNLVNARIYGVATTNFQNVRCDYYASVKLEGSTLWQDLRSFTFPASGSVTVPIGSVRWTSPSFRIGCVNLFGYIPVCVSGRVGVAGRLYATLHWDLGLLIQEVGVTPGGELTGFGEAWAEAPYGVAAVSVRGNLTFFYGWLAADAEGRVLLRLRDNYRLGADYQITASLYAFLRALSGNIEAYVRGCLPWRCYDYVLPIFSWSGINWSGYIASWSDTRRIDCQ